MKVKRWYIYIEKQLREVSAKMKQSASWDKTYSQFDEYTEEMLHYWKCICPIWSFAVTVREFISDWGSARHLCIAKELPNKKALEPTMGEKRNIIKGVKAERDIKMPVAFEIFPAKDNIVDKYDVYHLWIVGEKSIPFRVNINPLKFVFHWKTRTINGKHIFYTSKRFGFRKPVKVYFLKPANGSELRWYDKQNFKDQFIGKDVVALEVITDQYLGYSALICVPKAFSKLPFGLR